MDAKELPARPNLEHYKKLAKDLLKAYRSGDTASLKRFQEHLQLPQLTWVDLRKEAQTRLRKLRRSKIIGDKLTLADAQLLIAHSCAFESWPKFKKHIEAVLRKSSRVSRFESAVDAVVTGEVATLKRLLRENPELIKQRSTRAHQSTLLHYVSANGVEDFRQKTPKNAVEVTRILLAAGAEVDAENADGGRSTALGLVATSVHPARAGVQIALLELLLQAGASPNGLPGGWNPLIAALHNGRGDAAKFLAERGARLDLEGAAGVGRLDAVKTSFAPDGKLKPPGTPSQMEDGFLWACEYGHYAVIEFLLEKGIDVATKRGCTGLHWASYGGHLDVVRLLLRRKAPIDAKDETFGGTPLGWALYAWGSPPPEAKSGRYYEVVELLVAAGATIDAQALTDDRVRADPRMLAALRGEAPR
jgi:ankyrin repeat protein